MLKTQEDNPIPNEVSLISPLIVEIDEKKFRKLEVHLVDLLGQYNKLADKESYRLETDTNSLPPRAVFRTEYDIRASYNVAKLVVRELLEGNEFHIRSRIDSETGMIEKMEYRVAGKSRKISGEDTPNHFVDLIETLGLDQISENSPTQELILKPNFPRSIDRAELRELPQPK